MADSAVDPPGRETAGAARGMDGGLSDGMALCLSGGGYRAMLFHVGVLWRLNELGYLPRLARISSVSGGSITAGVLGLHWRHLRFDAHGVGRAFVDRIVDPIRTLGGETIDAGAITGGIALPGSVSDRIIGAYRELLFGDATLQDLPDDPPRFVINATNLQSGALWRFMKPAMRDYRVGSVPSPTVSLATAVAASSAFPPVLSPVYLDIDAADYDVPTSGEDLHRAPFTTRVVLSDGGVYDNLGLETAWKRYRTIFVSDAGGKLAPEPEPKTDWARHSMRVLETIDNQVRSLRKRQIVGAFVDGTRQGAYWGIRTHAADYGAALALPCPLEDTTELAAIRTRLKRIEPALQERLINWGYAVSDAALRRYHDPGLPVPAGFPYSRGV
jgi:NTE family protein